MLSIFCCDYFSVEPLQRTALRADGALLLFELSFRARFDNHFPGRCNEHRGPLRNCDLTECDLFFGDKTKKAVVLSDLRNFYEMQQQIRDTYAVFPLDS